MMLQFVNSIWLFGALAGGAMALVLGAKLWSRWRSGTVEWSAMELVDRIEPRLVQVRREDRRLLALRLTAVALLGLALARPTIDPTGDGGDARRQGALIAVDLSYSMDHHHVQSRIERARQQVMRIGAMIAPATPVTLVAMGHQPRVLWRQAPMDHDRLATVMRTLTPAPEAMDLGPNLAALGRLADETDAREVYIVSDAQMRDWQVEPDADSPARGGGAMGEAASAGAVFGEGAFGRADGDGGGPALLLVHAGRADHENLSIERLERAGAPPQAKALGRWVVVVANHGRRPARAVEVTLNVDGEVVGRQRIQSIEPGGSAAAAFSLDMPIGSGRSLRAMIGADALLADNVRYAAAGPRRPARVLLVDGDPAPQRFERETAFIEPALRFAAGRIEGSHIASVEWVGWDEWPQVLLGSYDVVVLANVPTVGVEQARRLAQWVGAGGGLMVFTGDRVDVDAWNRTLGGLPPSTRRAEDDDAAAGADLAGAQSDVKLLPGLIQPSLPAMGSPGWMPQATYEEDRLAWLLRIQPAGLIDSIRVRRRHPLLPHEDATVLWQTNDGAPLLVSRPYGQGQVLWMGTSADRQWNDLPVFNFFALFVNEAIASLSRPEQTRPYVVGQTPTVTLPPKFEGERVHVHHAGRMIGEVGVVHEAGRAAAALPTVKRPGVYVMDDEQGRRLTAIAVNLARDESDVRSLSPDQWARMAPAWLGRAASVAGPADDLEAMIERQREGTPLAPVLLALALVALLIESHVGRRYARRMIEPPPLPARPRPTQPVAEARQPVADPADAAAVATGPTTPAVQA